MIHITVADYLAAQDRVVASKPEGYVYPEALRVIYGSCQYVVNDKAACIAGATLVEIGVPAEAIHVHEDNPVETVLRYLADAEVLTFDEAVGPVAYAAQEVQDIDTRQSWREGVDNSWAAANQASKDRALFIEQYGIERL